MLIKLARNDIRCTIIIIIIIIIVGLHKLEHEKLIALHFIQISTPMKKNQSRKRIALILEKIL